MQIPSARLTISCNGACVTVHPGGLIRALKLLALRGGLTVEGRDVDVVTLERGLRVELADGLFITVERVDLPTHTLVLCGAAQGPVELGSSTHSLLLGEGGGPRTLRLVAGFVANAAGHLWSSGARLWIRLREQEPEMVVAGGQWSVEGVALRVIQVPLDGTSDTVDGARAPMERSSLVIVARYTSVHVQREGGTAVLTGKPANLVSELVRFGGKPVPWDMLSRRLRRQLRELAIREDLVSLDGSGNVELVLYPGDRLVDET